MGGPRAPGGTRASASRAMATDYVRAQAAKAAAFSPEQVYDGHRKDHALRISTLLDRLERLGEQAQDRFLASLSDNDRTSVAIAMRELEVAETNAIVASAGPPSVDAYLEMMAQMSEEEQDRFLAGLSDADRSRINAELLATPEQGSKVSEGSVRSSAYGSCVTGRRASSSAISRSVNSSGFGAAPTASVKQQLLQQQHDEAVSAAVRVRQAGLDAHALRHTGSELRIKQQLGLAPTGDMPVEDTDHVWIPKPSDAEVEALVQLGYERSQAALICMVDSLVKQGFTPLEAQKHVTKAAARNLAGWYIESGVETHHEREQEVKTARLPDPRLPARAPIPLSSLNASLNPVSAQHAVLDEPKEAADAEDARAPQLPPFWRIRREANERDRVFVEETLGADPNSSRWDLSLQSRRANSVPYKPPTGREEVRANASAGSASPATHPFPSPGHRASSLVPSPVPSRVSSSLPAYRLPATELDGEVEAWNKGLEAQARRTVWDLGHLSLEEKAAVLASWSDEDKAELLKEMPDDEVQELFNLLERLEAGSPRPISLLTHELLGAMNYLQQAIILAVPPPKFLLQDLPPPRRKKVQEFCNSQVFRDLKVHLHRWQYDAPQGGGGGGGGGGASMGGLLV